jgi:hydrogenase-1 operon protein HyaF
MTDFSFLADDRLVDSLITEIAGLLRRLIEQDEAGSIDLLGLPLSPSCLAALSECLGQGEIAVQLDAAGRSTIRETGFPGVWWTTHADKAGRIVAMLIEVAFVPDIVRVPRDDVTRGFQRLPNVTRADGRRFPATTVRSRPGAGTRPGSRLQ